MHHSVEILLKRMETHPEDFVQGANGKWLATINAYKKFFNEEEGTAVRDGLRKINLEHMTEEIMKRMVADEEPKATLGLDEWIPVRSQPKTILTSPEMVKAMQTVMKKLEDKEIEIDKVWVDEA